MHIDSIVTFFYYFTHRPIWAFEGIKSIKFQVQIVKSLCKYVYKVILLRIVIIGM